MLLSEFTFFRIYRKNRAQVEPSQAAVAAAAGVGAAAVEGAAAVADGGVGSTPAAEDESPVGEEELRHVIERTHGGWVGGRVQGPRSRGGSADCGMQVQTWTRRGRTMEAPRCLWLWRTATEPW